ncbi:MAG: ABC transporter ATP-binding protein [Bacteroides sp.]|nr:ABC transporter ATP-binding protein [Prevotella sp.]MCM1406964.1 ABC transporter ATP-binding protein [Treponema brennaborense]MCM1470115.1 ABC transporter ATP-binding protein [Bacteroides sp.]
MNTPFLSFTDVRFSYPVIAAESEEIAAPPPVFDAFSAELPASFMHLVGPNACGKSTLMLLSAGRLCPQQGCVKLLGTDTRAFFSEQSIFRSTADTDNPNEKKRAFIIQMPNPEKETEKNLLASFVYQNMEFEDDGKTGALLEFVFDNGGHRNGNLSRSVPSSFFDDTLNTFKLKPLLSRKLTGLSKSEIQRVLSAFSVLYGAKSIFMDEPFFAMETAHKEAALEFFRAYNREYAVPVYISMHEIELTRKYAEQVLLMYPDRTMELGTPNEVLTAEALEKAYGVPAAMLHETETLSRKNLAEQEEFRRGRRENNTN